MEEIMSLSVETRKEGQGPKIPVLLVHVPQCRAASRRCSFGFSKILRVSCGASALFCRFSMNDHSPRMSMYSHVICVVYETSSRIIGVVWVERYIDSSGQLFIWIS